MDKTSPVDCYLYFMWNAWDYTACKKLFPAYQADHIWSKWVSLNGRYGAGAPAVFYSEIDREIRAALVAAAVAHYGN